MKDRIN